MLDEAIAAARGYIGALERDNSEIIGECNLIMNLLMENTDYYDFCMKTKIGDEYNKSLEDLFRILREAGDRSAALVSQTQNI